MNKYLAHITYVKRVLVYLLNVTIALQACSIWQRLILCSASQESTKEFYTHKTQTCLVSNIQNNWNLLTKTILKLVFAIA